MLFAQCLNKICMNLPEEDSEDDIMLRSREIFIGHDHKDYPLKAMHVYAKNSSCDEWNEIMLSSLDGDTFVNTAKDGGGGGGWDGHFTIPHCFDNILGAKPKHPRVGELSVAPLPVKEVAPPSQIPGLNLTQFNNIGNFRPNVAIHIPRCSTRACRAKNLFN